MPPLAIINAKAAPWMSLAAAVLLSTITSPHSHASIPIWELGSDSFEIDPGVTTVSYTQTAGDLNLTNSFALGDTLGGAFNSFADPIALDLNSFPAFGLEMSISGGTAPNATFSVQFFDSSFKSLNVFNGEITTLSTNRSVVWLSLQDFPPNSEIFSLANIAGLQFTWDTIASASSTTTIHSLVGAEPEGFFVARSPGGFRFITTATTTNLSPTNPWSGKNGAILPAGASAWQALSDSNAKTDITPVDHRKVLRELAALPVRAWNYKHDPDRRYIGPMAQDFRAAFGLGFDEKHISTLDADGVALSALKGLIAELQERKERSKAQAKRLAELEAELRPLQEQVLSNLPPEE